MGITTFRRPTPDYRRRPPPAKASCSGRSSAAELTPVVALEPMATGPSVRTTGIGTRVTGRMVFSVGASAASGRIAPVSTCARPAYAPVSGTGAVALSTGGPVGPRTGSSAKAASLEVGSRATTRPLPTMPDGAAPHTPLRATDLERGEDPRTRPVARRVANKRTGGA